MATSPEPNVGTNPPQPATLTKPDAPSIPASQCAGDCPDPGADRALLQAAQAFANGGLESVLQRLGGPVPFWENVVDLLSEAVFLVGADRRIVYWNRAAEELTGYPRSEVLGLPCLNAVHCEVCEHRCGVFEMGEVRNVPLVIRDREGRSVQVLKSATAVRADDGSPIVGIEVLRDMTEWNERERQSAEARQTAQRDKARLEGVFDAVTDGILVVSSDARARFLSAPAVNSLGLNAEEVSGRPVAELVGDEVAAMVQHVLSSRSRVARARVAIRRTDGLEVGFALSVAPMSVPGEQDGAIAMLRDLQQEERTLREGVRAAAFRYGAMVSRSSRMQEVFDLVDQVAPTLATVLIQGESGTGKELVARELHRRSRRSGGPFHAVNCAAIASEILESEFFGHERGAFTGAVAQKPGRFELAHTGTIFLDEVGELPLDLQGKLLRVLEQRSFERVGGTRTIQVDVRVIAATNRDLSEMVRQRTFREDLYYRLRVVPLRLPALRERIEDLELLADHFLRLLAEREGKPSLRLSPEALRVLLDHDWPGNVRELSNAMEYAAVVARTDLVGADDLPRELREHASLVQPDRPCEPRRLRSDAESWAGMSRANERARIESALQATRYSQADTARMLGMHRTTLYRKRLRYGI